MSEPLGARHAVRLCASGRAAWPIWTTVDHQQPVHLGGNAHIQIQIKHVTIAVHREKGVFLE